MSISLSKSCCGPLICPYLVLIIVALKQSSPVKKYPPPGHRLLSSCAFTPPEPVLQLALSWHQAFDRCRCKGRSAKNSNWSQWLDGICETSARFPPQRRASRRPLPKRLQFPAFGCVYGFSRVVYMDRTCLISV